ncbi:hypothetical protein BT69DRAFT_554321 [Atractiella rhizophila]|nr:hypothetical protein BT69DRAFT_554321 [Atractiella rhizophila]
MVTLMGKHQIVIPSDQWSMPVTSFVRMPGKSASERYQSSRCSFDCSSHFHTRHVPHPYRAFTDIMMSDYRLSTDLAFTTVKRGEDDWYVGIVHMKLKLEDVV